MKRVISLLLAILMVTGMLTVFGVATAAEGGTPTTTKYVVYEEDFDLMEARASSEEVLEALGWYVPSDKVEKNIAQYQIVNGALRVDTSFANAIQGVPDTFKSFVTVFSGDIMSIVRNGDFTVSYDLTYRSGTTNYNNYTAMIYNYTETDNEEHKEAYGIAAVRPCGSGFNGIYSPISAGLGTLEGWENESELAMNNANTKVAAGYPSLYSRIAASLGDTTYTDTAPLQGKNLLIDKTVRVRLEYDYTDGMRVFLNDVQVSEVNKDIYVDDTNYSGLWSTFLDESKGAAIGLLTLPYVVADIDNIKVEAVQVGSEGIVNQLPELVITEICVLGNSAQPYGEFIELFNPTDRPLDLRDYSIYEASFSAGTIDDAIMPDRMMYKFNSRPGSIGALTDHIDNTRSYSNTYFAHVNDLRALYDFANLPAEDNNRFEFVDNNKYTDSKGRGVSPDGMYRKVRYVEEWNSIFHMEDGWDTMLAPGECALVCIGSQSYPLNYSNGVNGGLVSKNFNVNTMNFRSNYRKYGLSKDTKIIFAEVSALMWDHPSGDKVGGNRYYVTKTYYDEPVNGERVRIDYPNHYTHDINIDPYIVSYIDLTGLFDARATPSLHNNPDDKNFGMAGFHLDKGLSATYVYGVDASRDARCGTLYQNQHTTGNSNADVGTLSGPQEIIMQQMYKSNGTLPALSITEVVPNTNNLAGESKKAFTAMELTNTSSMEVNVYDYALVCTETNNNCKLGAGFSYVMNMAAGNPVKRTDGNGSYFYFAEEHISNPETCILAPGESAVVWFLTEDTYTSYQRDAAFGFDYFRQYWANQGNPQLGIKKTDGDYAVKVIAVDANKSNVYNPGNNKLNFELSVFDSVVYGVANASESVLRGDIYFSDVINVAIFGFVSCHYGLTYGSAVSAVTGTTYYGMMILTMPANVSMRYVVGGCGNSRVSALASSVRVARYWYPGGAYKSEKPLPYSQRSLVVNATYAPMEVRLGTLDDKEILPVFDKLFVKETASGNVTYRYFDELRTNILTLQGAAIDTAGAKPVLRFDNAVSNSVYSSLVATYGDKVEIGTLIVKTDALGDRKTFTETDLQNAGIDYKKVANKLLYRSADYTVLSASIEAEGNDTSYTAVGYMKVTLNDGRVMTYYSADTTSRSVKEVAIAAIGDIYDAKEGIYQYDSVDNTANVTNYSPYTTAVQQKLKSYAGL